MLTIMSKAKIIKFANKWKELENIMDDIAQIQKDSA